MLAGWCCGVGGKGVGVVLAVLAAVVAVSQASSTIAWPTHTTK